MFNLASRIALFGALLIGVLSGFPAPADAAGDVQVPFTATFSTVDTYYTNADGCPSPLCFRETGSGTATQLGSMTSNGGGFVTSRTVLDATHVKYTLHETHTLTGANGDSITFEGNSSAIQDLSTGAISAPAWQYTITHGTGRFAGATGSGLNYGTQQANSAGTGATGTFTCTGTISSPGAH